MGDGEVLLPFLKKGDSCRCLQTEQLEPACGQTRAVPAGARTRGRGGGRFRRGLAWQGQSLETGPHPGLATVQLPDLLQALTSLSSLQGGS